ncbi:MAG TPA: hypothetical protein VK012_06160, partial [Gemmatimonadales bacterium]|nr:hypothetical protein [Gemmatimonadales bacterium]
EAAVPIESLAPSGRTVLEQGFDTYRRLVAHPVAAEGSAEPKTVAQAPPPAGDADVVDINSLCYSGRAEPLVRELLDLIPLALAG